MEKPRLHVIIPAHNEEKLIGTALSALAKQEVNEPFRVTVVDNASTDNTSEAVERFAASSEIDVQLIHEDEKGTGAAADTGIRHAIEQGAEIVARTDADTLVSRRWLARAAFILDQRPRRKIVTGPTFARHDDTFTHSSDYLTMPTFIEISRVLYWILHPSSKGKSLKFPIGNNTILRSSTYEALGGYPRTDIATKDEDYELATALFDREGMRAFAYHPQVNVAISMRRIRQFGWPGMFDCYILRPNKKELRQKYYKGLVDVR